MIIEVPLSLDREFISILELGYIRGSQTQYSKLSKEEIEVLDFVKKIIKEWDNGHELLGGHDDNNS